MAKKQIFFLGCGKMGRAMINSFLKSGFDPSSFLVLKPTDNNKIPSINYVTSYQNIDKNYQADIIFFAFKPQMVEQIIKDFSEQEFYNPDTIFISILAGTKIEFFENALGKNIKLIRAMPNLPIVIGEGIFAYFCNPNIKENEILSYINFLGQNVKLEKEELIDAITAISGSGPAYLFLFNKVLSHAAIKLGFDKNLAEKIVKQTIYGSAKMALESKEDLNQMIENVASRGGTTEAALEVFNQNNNFEKIINDAVFAAYNRAKELSSPKQ